MGCLILPAPPALEEEDGERDDARAEQSLRAQPLAQQQGTQYDGYDWLEVAEDGGARGGYPGQGGVVDEIGRYRADHYQEQQRKPLPAIQARHRRPLSRSSGQQREREEAERPAQHRAAGHDERRDRAHPPLTEVRVDGERDGVADEAEGAERKAEVMSHAQTLLKHDQHDAGKSQEQCDADLPGEPLDTQETREYGGRDWHQPDDENGGDAGVGQLDAGILQPE